MTQVISNVEDYKVVADNGFQFNVNVRGLHNYGNRKWMIEKVGLIRDYFTFTDGADRGLIIDVIVNTHEIIVKAEFNGKKYWAYPIHPKFGKKQIREMLSNMGVVDDVMAVYTNNMVNNNMEENNMVDMVNNVGMFNVYVKIVLVEDFKNAVDTAEDFANEYGDTLVENEHICGDFEYDYDIRDMWADWCWENDVMSRDAAYKYYDANGDMFIDEDDLCECVYEFEDTYGVGIEDNCCGSCLIWVFNPYYVSEDAVKNDSPCLERVVDTIKDYVNNYEGMLMNYDGNSASICVPWDVFNEDDMKMLIEDDGFEGCVVGALIGRDIKDVLVYDDGVYVSVNAEKFDKVA